MSSENVFSSLGVRYRSFRYIVTDLATAAAVKTNHFGSQVGRKRRYRYLQKELILNRIIHHKQFSSKLYSNISLTNIPLSCAVYGCSNHNQKEETNEFYRFPDNSAVLRQKWINACKRVNKDGTPWNPQGKDVYIWGKHFISGKSSE